MTDLIPCANPYCPNKFEPGNDFVQVDIPGKPFLAFCNVKCLGIWINHHAATSFQELQ